MYKIVILAVFLTTTLFSLDNATYVKEKNEIESLKKELNDFYTLKENEYIQRQKELDQVLNKIEKEKKELEELKKHNETLLAEIENKTMNKTAKIYNGMKPKIAAEIFDKMIFEGNILDVFDIIIKLKEKQVTDIMKFLNVENAAKLTQMLKSFQLNKQGS